ncbi:glycosyltransferase family 2 protein [Bacillus sp. Marseille-P3661]|uniref:glycosyltransferase family 2 protein n=1 Tax=Bacillus sp. Marseille-P3661 TaxID=1936234 RepID=UPI000C865721|nr:glycosyltransferase family 2 protein [Bacillus sp. Marseille-P3661]
MFDQLYNILFVLIQLVVGIIGIYQIVLGFAGLYKKKEMNPPSPSKSFAVVVAAHNEESVIEPLLKNLKQLDYPAHLYDIFVICDNCTDKTADIVRKHGLNPMERTDLVNKGKGHAIEWMLTNLWKKERSYDAVIIFDADNLVSLNYLAEMNRKLLQGHKIIQGFLETKNPYDSWVSISYAIGYWYINRAWQLARYNLGMANILGGTGMCFDAKLLKEMGWNSHSLTEDVEFTARSIINGIYPTWANEAIIYDEKPVTLMSSYHQRIRWMRGHIDCANRYMWPLIKVAFKKRSLKIFDAALYMFQPFRLLMVVSISLLLSLHLATSVFEQLGVYQIVPFWVFWAYHIIVYLQIPLIMALEKKKWKAFLGLLIFPIFQLTWFPITLIALLTTRNKSWNHTIHTRSIQIEDVTRP